MSLKRITAPSVDPIDLATAKLHMRVTHSEEDALIPIYISAAVAYLDGPDGILGRSLVTQTWEYSLDCFPSTAIKIPLPPLQYVTSISYVDADGATQVLDSARYTVDIAGQPGWVVVDEDGWPDTMETANAVTIRFVCGYGLAASVPASLRAAMLLHVGDLYENRQTGQGQEVYQNPAFMSLVYPYRILSV